MSEPMPTAYEVDGTLYHEALEPYPESMHPVYWTVFLALAGIAAWLWYQDKHEFDQVPLTITSSICFDREKGQIPCEEFGRGIRGDLPAATEL